MAKKQRARNKEGKFIADDPTTPENEAWVTPENNSEASASVSVTGVGSTADTKPNETAHEPPPEPEKSFMESDWVQFGLIFIILTIVALWGVYG